MASELCSGSSFCETFLNYIVPSIGCLTTGYLFYAPLPDVIKAHRTGILGEINTLPFVLMIMNSLGWINYGMFIQNYFVAGPNLFGFVLGLYCLICTYPLTTPKIQSTNLTLLLSLLSVIYFIYIVCFVSLDGDAKKYVMGVTVNAVLVAFYGSPLTSMWKVVQSRCCASLNLGVAIAALLNSLLWGIYGTAVRDIFIAMPNGLGVISSIAQLSLMWYYPREPVSKDIRSQLDIEGEAGYESGVASVKMPKPAVVVSMVSEKEMRTVFAEGQNLHNRHSIVQSSDYSHPHQKSEADGSGSNSNNSSSENLL